MKLRTIFLQMLCLQSLSAFIYKKQKVHVKQIFIQFYFTDNLKFDYHLLVIFSNNAIISNLHSKVLIIIIFLHYYIIILALFVVFTIPIQIPIRTFVKKKT